MRRPDLLTAFVALALVTGVGACGGEEVSEDEEVNVRSEVLAAAAAMVEARTFKIEMTTSGLVHSRGSMQVDLGRVRSGGEIYIGASDPAFDIPQGTVGEARSHGDRVAVRYDDARLWLDASGGGPFERFYTNPANLFISLDEAFVDIDEAGHEKITGVRTKRYEGKYSVDAIIEQLEEPVSAEEQAEIDAMRGLRFPLALNVGDDGLIHHMTLNIAVPGAEMEVTMEISEIGEPVEIKPLPSPELVVTLEDVAADPALVERLGLAD